MEAQNDEVGGAVDGVAGRVVHVATEDEGLLRAARVSLPEHVPDPARHDELAGDVFYQVFVRSFADADGDGVGDLAGLTARLDYLNDGDPATGGDLGVDGLWLMPVFESPSYHGYDVVDYLTIDREYGGNEAFYRLLDEAHRRGLRVIVDFVINHSGSGHPWFQAAAASPRSPWRDWYLWRDDDPGWTQPWGGYPTWHPAPRGDGFYYGIFWGGMPDLNAGNPEVRAEIARIAAHWLAVGVDGFRLDATRHLFADGDGERQNDRPETHAFLREFGARVRALDPTAVLVGENWTTTERIAAYYGATDRIAGGDELPLNFNFPLADAIVAGVRDGDAAPIAATLAAMAERYPPGVLDAPFLRNHDQLRLATELEGVPGRLRLAWGHGAESDPEILNVVGSQTVESGIGHRARDLLRGLDREGIVPNQRALGGLELLRRHRFGPDPPELGQHLA